MYEDYYRFHRQPFSPTPDPEFLYKSESHQEALEQLLRGVRRREGMLLLTGDVGTGKTTTTRALLQLLERDVFTALVLNPFVGADELLRVLLQDFGVVSDSGALRAAGRQSLVETLNQFLLSLASVGASALAVVDEAQNLTPAVLEQLRVLTTLETDQFKLLQILLVGQPELQTLLGGDDLRPLNQRIARRCALRALTREEVEQYIGFRLRMARGAWETMFTQRAVDLIYEFSEGIPRKINLICDRALEAGFIALSPTIDEPLVTEAAEALELIPPREPVVRPRRRWFPVPRRPGRRTLSKGWVAAAVTVGAVVGISTAIAALAPWTPGPRPAVLEPLKADGLALPAAVDFVVGVDPALTGGYSIRIAGFGTRLTADVTVAMLQSRGAEAAVVRGGAEGTGGVVWVGPYASLTGARSMERMVRQTFRFLDVRLVAGETPEGTLP